MGFWENVDAEREYKNLSRKELAYRADFSLTSLSTGIKRNSIPAADVALRIAKVLNVSIEYLLTGTEMTAGSTGSISAFPQKYHKYRPFIEEFASLPASVQKSIEMMIKEIKQYAHPAELQRLGAGAEE